MKVLVCGGRDYADRARVERVLDDLYVKNGITEVIEGRAKGADSLAEDWAMGRNVALRHFPADWDRYGRGAGPRRNRQMLVEGEPDLVVAFLGGRGTANMVSQAEKAGVPVQKVGW